MSSLPRRIGKYDLIEPVGRGGMAEVWKALDTQLDRHVAIKFLHADLRTDPTFMTRFVREAQAIAALHHPNIVKIHDFQITSAPGFEGSLAFMVMNFIEGPMLSEYIARTSRIGKYPFAADIVHLFTAIGRAIDYAHQRGMVHRDIKPTNILLEERNTLRHPMGEPILTDFGIVKLMGASGSTLSGVILGTPNYISPEQAQGQPGNERSDIYSFGVILYEICTGVRPFQGDSAVSIIMQHISATPPPPHFINPSLPPAVSEVILHSLAKNQNERFPDASSMTTALSKAFNLTPIVGSSSGPYTLETMKGTGSTGSGSQSVKPVVFSTQSPPTAGYQTPRNDNSSGQFGQYTPITETGNFSDEILNQNSGQNTPTHIMPSSGVEPISQFASQPPLTPAFKEAAQNNLAASGQPLNPFLSAPPPKKSRKVLYVTLTISLIMVLLVASLSTIYFYANNKPHTSPPPENLSVGNAIFLSSVSLNGNTNQGVNDELQITLQNIPAPSPGKSYYAWLLSDKVTTAIQSIFLGKLTVINGKVELFYLHDQQDTDLLSNTSRFVITEENDSTKPIPFSSDTRSWRYYAEIPQTPDSSENPSSVLMDIRLLLSDDTVILHSTNFTGGMAFGLTRSTQQVLALVRAAENAWNNQDTNLVHSEIVRTLDYLDGDGFVQRDLPPGQNLLINPALIQAPLLDYSQGQSPAGYLTRISSKLQELIGEPGVTSIMTTLANQVLKVTPDVQSKLEQVRSGARQLVTMTDTQLLQSTVRDVLDSMVTQANDAYEGQIDTTTNTSTSGINFIVETIQRLPTFDVQPYKSE